MATKVKKLKSTRKGRKMSEVKEPEAKQEQKDDTLLVMKSKGDCTLEIRADNGSAGRLEVYFRHPVLAAIIEKMSMGNYQTDQYDKIYAPCLQPYPNPKAVGKSVSRPAIYNATKNFVAQPDFDFSQPPRGVLISNPEALRKGFSLFVDLKTPVPQDVLRKWGKMVMDGASDIVAASRPFRMVWVASEVVPGKL